MKVLLVNPPNTRSVDSSVSRGADKDREHRPRLGVLFVAASAASLPGVEVLVLDCDVEGIGYDTLGAYLKDARPDVIGISALTFTIIDALKTARIAKEALPGVKVCLGGYHVTYYPLETLKFDAVDFIICGEGEDAFVAFLRALKGEILCDEVPGLGHKTSGDIRLNKCSGGAVNMDAITQPAHHLIDLNKYTHVLSGGSIVSSIQATRGCPYGCAFCDIRKSKFRRRSADNILSEIKYLMSRSVLDFFFVDDTITLDKQWLVNLCERIIDENLKITFKISSRVDTISSLLLVALKTAGCKWICYGVESGIQRLLDYLDKGITIEQTKEAFRLTHEAGIKTMAYAMIGIPTETEEEMHLTGKFIQSLKATYVSYSICTPYPKTALYHRMLREGLIPYDYWQEFAEAPRADFKVPFWNKEYSDEHLREIQSELMKEFYSRPSFIFREIINTQSVSQLARKAKLGMKLLKVFDRGSSAPT